MLRLATQLRTTSVVADIARLRDNIVVMLSDFQAQARDAGISGTRVAAAAQILAALIDHIVPSMPWGVDAGWSSVGKGTATPRRPAERLLDLADESANDPQLKEMLEVAVALGFDKRSRGAEGPAIESLFARLTPRGDMSAAAAGALSPPLPAMQRRRLLTSWLPLWVSSLLVAALLAALFFGLRLSLGAKSDRLYARVAALNGDTRTGRPQPAAETRLAAALSGVAAAHHVIVRDDVDRSIIVVPDAELFTVSEPALTPGAVEVLRPIASGLQANPGKIRIIDHTDGTMTRSARYPSEWDLSVDRAHAVRDALGKLGIDAARMSFDGRGNIEPAHSDAGATDAGATDAAGSGRVEIILLAGR